jgi:hypothetical protein
MYRRPFLVLPDGDCVPLEGDWRVETLRGEWYVLGHNSVFRFKTEQEAEARLAHLRGTAEPNDVAARTLELADAAGDANDLAALVPADHFGEADLR